jgi:uncharacterized protein (DUF1786 family)
MRILAIDMGTGTQDVLLFDSAGPIENCFKMVMPSATRIAEGRIRASTDAGRGVVLTGVTQGGGPCHWALEDHLREGYAAYATPDAARTFDDDLDRVAAMGITLVSDDEAARIDANRVVLQDLDLPAIRTAMGAFDVSPRFDGLAVACLDHGAAPPGYSDRLFRFDHLRRVVGARNDLRAFAMLPGEIPEYLTRARTMTETARAQDTDGTPIVFLDTGPAAALGALQDARVRDAKVQLVLNLGNMHALAFHVEGTHIISLYEHHTGEMSCEQIDDFTRRLSTGELRHAEVFDTKGHGVFYSEAAHLQAARRAPPAIVAVTGPQRSKIRGSALDPYFVAPHGDMMISGCFGLLVAFAEKYPEHAAEIESALAEE